MENISERDRELLEKGRRCGFTYCIIDSDGLVLAVGTEKILKKLYYEFSLNFFRIEEVLKNFERVNV